MVDMKYMFATSMTYISYVNTFISVGYILGSLCNPLTNSYHCDSLNNYSGLSLQLPQPTVDIDRNDTSDGSIPDGDALLSDSATALRERLLGLDGQRWLRLGQLHLDHRDVARPVLARPPLHATHVRFGQYLGLTSCQAIRFGGCDQKQ